MTHGVLQNLGELLISRSTNDAHYVKELVLIVPTAEERNSRYHFSEDTAAGPDINRSAICSRSEKDIRGTVPEGDNLGT